MVHASSCRTAPGAAADAGGGDTGADTDKTPSQAADGERRRQEREVRLTTQRIVRDHLRPGDQLDPTETFWGEIDLDLTGAYLIAFDLEECRVGTATFDGAQFTNDSAFSGTKFVGPTSFIDAQFTGNCASFDRAEFTGPGPTMFRGAQFTSSDYTSFVEAQFKGDGPGPIFAGARFAGQATLFSDAQFTGDRASFDRADFTSSNYTSFEEAQFTDNTSFDDADFTSAHTTFQKTQFTDNISFLEARFTGDTVIVPTGWVLEWDPLDDGESRWRRLVRKPDAEAIDDAPGSAEVGPGRSPPR